jgi:alpha-beta hydrolase superfamily lysophospholipase
VRIVQPAAPRVRLLFTHASLVHSEYYLPLAAQLARFGIETWLPDLRGHGRSAGTRGHTRNWRDPLEDVAFVWRAMRAAGPVALTLAGGESYGAVVTYCAIRSGDIAPDAAVFMSPAFGLHFHPSRLTWLLLTRGAWPAAGWVRPLLALPVGKVAENTAVRRMIDRDPLCNRRYTLGFLLHLLAAQRRVPAPDPSWRTRTLLLLSAEDPVVDNGASRAVFAGNGAVASVVGATGFHSLVADESPWLVEHLTDWIGTLRPATGRTHPGATELRPERRADVAPGLAPVLPSWLHP